MATKTYPKNKCELRVIKHYERWIEGIWERDKLKKEKIKEEIKYLKGCL